MFFSLSEATSLGEGKLRLKIDLASYPAQVEGLVNMIMLSFLGGQLLEMTIE